MKTLASTKISVLDLARIKENHLMKLLLIFSFLFWCLSASATMSGEEKDAITQLRKTAAESLTANIITLPSGSYLVAGQHQYKTLWTRDFCHSIRGLLKIGRADVVRSHLTKLVEQARPSDGLVPRVIDSIPVQVRVVLAALHFAPPIQDPLYASYVDEHGSEAIDSNALVILGALDYVESTNDQVWWATHERQLIAIVKFYESRRRADGLIVQTPFSDWQDSVNRGGVTSYANLLYLRALTLLAQKAAFGINPADVAVLKSRIKTVFFKDGLYHALENDAHISLEANLLALKWDFDGQSLYQTLKASALWQSKSGVPGFATTPDYPYDWKNWPSKLVGVTGYHDEVTWSWLTALSGNVARHEADGHEALRIFLKLAKMAARDGVIGEIYDTDPTLAPYRHWLYYSETPFSWGAANILEAL